LLLLYFPHNTIMVYDKILDWFYNFDFDRDSLLKITVIKREMIDRGLFEPEEVVMYEYNTDFDVSNLEV